MFSRRLHQRQFWHARRWLPLSTLFVLLNCARDFTGGPLEIDFEEDDAPAVAGAAGESGLAGAGGVAASDDPNEPAPPSASAGNGGAGGTTTNSSEAGAPSSSAGAGGAGSSGIIPRGYTVQDTPLMLLNEDGFREPGGHKLEPVSCPPGAIAVGFSVNGDKRQSPRSITLLCAMITADGRMVRVASSPRLAVETLVSAENEWSCPSGNMIIGVRGFFMSDFDSNHRISAYGFECGNLDDWLHGIQRMAIVGMFGNETGKHFVTMCKSGWALKSLSGSHNEWFNVLQAGCAEIKSAS